MEVNVKYCNSDCLQNCPASVDMATGVVTINNDVWSNYDDFEQRFIIWHEMGHYNLQTDNESEADRYALEHVYKTAPQSLKRSLQTLYKVGIINSQRMWNLYIEALKLDSADGNQDAALELINIEQQHKIMNKNAQYIKTNSVNRADGAQEEQQTTDKKRERGHGKNGLMIGSVYFSITNILLMIITVILISISHKIGR